MENDRPNLRGVEFYRKLGEALKLTPEETEDLVKTAIGENDTGGLPVAYQKRDGSIGVEQVNTNTGQLPKELADDLRDSLEKNDVGENSTFGKN